jgi:hypothetical protein
VIGHSNPSGFLDGNVFPESQRWVYPSYVAERLEATYSAAELQTGMADLGLTTPDLRTVLSPSPIPSPYFGIFDLPPFDIKARPNEFHTNLAVPGARLSDVLEFNYGSIGECDPGSFRCLFHFAANSAPYFALVNPTGMWPSQLDIAAYLKPKWILVHIGSNDVTDFVDPAMFEINFRTMLNRLTYCNSDVQIIVANVEYSPNYPGKVTTAEADDLLGLSQGTSADLYFYSTGVFPAPEDRFNLYLFAGYLLGLGDLPPLETVADQIAREAYKDAYNRALKALTKEFGAIYWDNDKAAEKGVRKGIEVKIDDTNYQLTSDYGGGIFSFQGTHVGKTAHASAANEVIKNINAKTKSKLPEVDVNAVACTDLHVRRALGLPEDPTQFSCPESY